MPDRRFEFLDLSSGAGLPEPEAETMAALHDIVDEGVLGASNHVALALPLVARIAASGRATARDEALALARFIAGTRGVAAPIVANALTWQTEGAEGLSPEAAADVLSDRADRWDREAKARRATLLARAAETLSACRSPLIHDYSSTVADIVRSIGAGLDRIVMTESRAIDGGRPYMTALADLCVPILFLPDAALDWAVARCDAVLLGAESVTLDGGVSNTIGSVMAARAGQAYGVPVYGAADLFKVGPRRAAEIPPPSLRSYPFLLKEGETASTEAPELEIVPPDLVTVILTEVGPIAPPDLAEALASRLP